MGNINLNLSNILWNQNRKILPLCSFSLQTSTTFPYFFIKAKLAFSLYPICTSISSRPYLTTRDLKINLNWFKLRGFVAGSCCQLMILRTEFDFSLYNFNDWFERGLNLQCQYGSRSLTFKNDNMINSGNANLITTN